MKDNVQTYKARLVVKVYRQKQRVETFSLVAMLKSIRILIAIATYHDYKIWQMNIKTTFLDESFHKDVYMK
jgi:hypothetical protein